jgi:outer membrane protein OmpA-like peptidoglycan-associated protein
MTKVLTTTISLGLAIALCAPAQAQMMRGGLGGLGGGLGGGLSGGLGGGFGRGLSVDGNAGVNGTVEAGDGAARSATRAGSSSRAPKVTRATASANATATSTTGLTAAAAGTAHAPSVSAAPVTMAARGVQGRVASAADHTGDRIAGRVESTRSGIARDVSRVTFVPAIPDYTARRAAIIESGIVPIAYADAPAYIDTQYQVLQNDLRGSGVEVVKRGQQIVLEMPSDVTFAFDKYDIQPRFRPVLDAVAQTLSKYAATYIDVDGHTDAIGSMAYNQTLSEKRAFSVANYLSEREVTPVRMHVEGFGKTEPVASNATVYGRAANRRVEIVLTPYVG